MAGLKIVWTETATVVLRQILTLFLIFVCFIVTTLECINVSHTTCQSNPAARYVSTH